MFLSWLHGLWLKFKRLFFFRTRSTPQLSTSVTSGSKELMMEVKEDVNDNQSRTLLWTPQATIFRVTGFMESFLHFGRNFGIGKTPHSSSLGLSHSHYVDTKEAEMLRDLYVVLWTMRERIRELVRRQEKRRRRHSKTPTCTSTPRESKQDARSPL